jgi:aryl-phospho-beta-D-glucosidase BglC (GH1 family)
VLKFQKKLRIIVFIGVFSAVIFGMLIANKPGTQAAAGSLSVYYRCGSVDARAQTMRPYITIYNNSGASVNLSDLKVRYYYTKEGLPAETLECFYVAVGTGNVNATFYPDKGYAEIGFTAAAGSIADGGNSGELQLALKKTGNGFYDQTNDYSYSPNITTATEYNKMTIYQNGTLVWGAEGPLPPAPPSPPPAGDDWLHTDGSYIRDAAGNAVRLTGINWFGYETIGSKGFYGLDKTSLEDTLDMLASRGFNLIRIPICAEIVKEWQNGTYVNYSNVSTLENPSLDGMHSLQILDYAINYMKRTGIKVMFDMHSAGRDTYTDNLWFNSKITMADFIAAWKWLANRYKGDDTVIAMDLKNEPHGKYSGPGIAKWDGSNDTNNWKKAAEDIGNAILSVNPNLLIMVEGVEAYPMEGYDYSNCGETTTYCNWWGSNLRGVAKYPVNLSTSGRVVYSAHDYGPDIYLQPWYRSTFNETTLYNDCWRPNWYYIVEASVAPVLIGEWGGKLENANNKTWLTSLASFLSTKNVHHTFWAVNPNSVDTGGLLKEDWKTVDEAKYTIIKSTLWMKGLDHVVKLGPASEVTPGPTPVRTATPPVTATPTPFVTATATPVRTVTPVRTATPRRTATPNRTATPRRTATPGSTTTPVVTAEPTPLITATPVVTATPTPLAGNIKIQFYNQSTTAISNQIYPNIKLVNTGTSAITLANVKIRYYYTIDGVKAQTFYCDYASIGSSNVIGTFVAMDTVTTGADTYLEVGFTGGAGSLAAGGNVIIQTRFAKSDWSNYTQSNDYSYNSTGTAYADWTKITGYVSGALQWGTEP